MTEVQALVVVCVVSFALCVGALFFTIVPTLRANGTRPILFTLSMVSLASFTGASALLYITYNLDQISSTGLAEVGVWWIRIEPGINASALIWLGWRLRKGGKH